MVIALLVTTNHVATASTDVVEMARRRKALPVTGSLNSAAVLVVVLLVLPLSKHIRSICDFVCSNFFIFSIKIQQCDQVLKHSGGF